MWPPIPRTSGSAASGDPTTCPATRSWRRTGASATGPAGRPHEGDDRAGSHARYADLDSVSVEFIDSEDFLNYRGGALIFNTAAGAYFQGFAYGPPNNKGYLVNAADQ
jgi:hypothetical protein